jgi:succinate dehydrogenase / fumarate reductase, cytochrome b subunit
LGYFTSSIGKKQIMAVTGLVWAGFVLSHMLGNLLIMAGPDAYNAYSFTLLSNPFIYIAEGALLLTIVVHVIDGIVLTIKNKSARKTKYAIPTNGDKAARFQSKWMIFHGSLIFVFLILHLIAFKYGPGEAEGYTTVVKGIEMRNLHKLVIENFQHPGFTAWYLFAMVIVGFHLSHGLYSSFASLGLQNSRINGALSKIGYVYAFVVALGFMVPPIYVFFMR